MHSRQLLVEASVAVIAVLALTKPVGAQTPQDGGRPVRTTALAPQRDEILVTGIRMGIAAARDEKRKADQIVDIVKAEDIEKLPNNTVGDAIALIPGLQVDRSEGEVNGIQLRGLSGVQTTLNGSPITSSLDRTAAISDLPADLVKSIEVYKTRTPEQVEGSGAGTINITLKRPLDFSRGLTGTAAANVRYNNQSKRYNQNYNAILNYNMDTAIGGLGFMVNATWNSNPFLESRAINDNFATLSSRQATGQQILPSPTFAPNQVQFSYITGERRSPTVSGAVQWSPDDRTDVVLEGTYTAIRKENDNNDLFVAITGGTGSTLPQLSNVVLVPGTNRLRSVTVATANQTGPIAYLFNQRNDQYFAKLSTIHRGDSFDASAEIQYGGSFSFNHDRTTRNRFVTRPIYDVDFASDRFKFPMVNVEFRNVDLLDASQYRFVQFDEQQRVNDSETWSGRADLTLRTSQPLLPEIRVGMRWQHQTYLRRVYQRGVGGLNIPMADMPEGWNRLVPIAEGFAGTGVVNNARWLAYGSDARPNLDKLIRFLAPFSSQFQAPTPPINNGDYFDGNEKTFGFYAQASYNFDLLVPIRGVFGARVVNTMLSLNSFERISRSRVVNGINQTVTDLVPNNARSNYVNVLPSINAIVAFTDELQFRVGWSRDMRRPSPYSLTPNIAFSELAFSGDAGNPDLRPEKTEKFDASLEYYFASRGLVSIAPFYWNLDGAFANFRTLEILGSDPQFYNIQRSYNAGRGYRRGVEVQGQAFATFLPGPLKGFGAIANYTFVDSQLEFDALPGGLTAPPAKAPIAGTSRNTFNVTGLYQLAGIDARVSYNWVGKRIDEIRNPLNLSLYRLPMTWMDVAVNYTFSKGPLRGLMISAQMQNALASAARNFYGFPDQPREVVYWARTYGGGMRYRF